MGAQPKRKTSKARKGKRRAHLRIAAPALILCPRCRNAKLPHHVCPTCGTYAGRDVLQI